jgi:hypothetical protein
MFYTYRNVEMYIIFHVTASNIPAGDWLSTSLKEANAAGDMNPE